MHLKDTFLELEILKDLLSTMDLFLSLYFLSILRVLICFFFPRISQPSLLYSKYCISVLHKFKVLIFTILIMAKVCISFLIFLDEKY